MIVLALVASGASIAYIFQRHVETRVQQELEKHFHQLVASVDVLETGNIQLTRELADPRFTLPMSGLYWQIDQDGKTVARSRSLWDQKLVVPTPPKELEEEHVHELAGPDGQMLFSLERVIFLNHKGVEKPFVVTLGLPRGEISDTVLSMTKDVAPALGVLGLVLLLATWFQIALGLKPLQAIERAVHGIREGGHARVAEDVADEVKPLVFELNALLEANENRNRASRQRAADLAHGLRTPLAVLGSLSRTVEQAGLVTDAGKIRLQTEHMRQQVERELAKALSSAEDVPVWLNVKAQVERLVKVVAMSRQDTAFNWTITIAPDAQCHMSRNDLIELLGSVLENAQKWGRSQATVSLSHTTLIIEDDGPGVASEDFAKLTERGFTAHSTKSSSGLGLAIAQQLADKNEIGLSFAASSLGGLQVSLEIPAARLRGTKVLIEA
jgi:signal transduction histidine kinase